MTGADRGPVLTADTVVTATAVHRPGWIAVDGARVTAVGAGPPGGGGPVLALGEVTVVPGFVDQHCHGGGGGAFTDPDGVAQAVAHHRAHGTTRLVADLVTAAPGPLLAQIDVLAGHVEAGVLAGVHLEGPWLSAHRPGAHQVDLLRDPDPAELDAVLRAGRGTVRMVTLAPERPGALDAIARLSATGVVAAVGHTDADWATTRAAVAAGARAATHLGNAMRPVHTREPGPVVALLEDGRVVLELIADGVHVHPALVRDVLRVAGPDRVTLVTDAMAAAGMPDGAYRIGDLPVTVAAGVARLTGQDTIAGGTATMDALFRAAVGAASEAPTDPGQPDRAGDPPGDDALLRAVRVTSGTSAALFGWADVGLIPGGAADLVVLDDELQVRGVMLAGSWIR